MSIEKVTDGGMETWASATDLTNWEEAKSGSSTVNREATTIHGGTYSCRLDIDASSSNADIRQNVTLISGGKYKIAIWYKNSAASKYARWQFLNATDNKNLKSDGTWATGTSYQNQLPNSTEYTEYTMEFVVYGGASSTFQLQLGRDYTGGAASSSIYFDDISVQELRQISSLGFSPRWLRINKWR